MVSEFTRGSLHLIERVAQCSVCDIVGAAKIIGESDELSIRLSAVYSFAISALPCGIAGYYSSRYLVKREAKDLYKAGIGVIFFAVVGFSHWNSLCQASGYFESSN